MKDIIDETGFSHGLIYKYYKDLDEVLRDLVIKINLQNKLDEKLDAIIESNESKISRWKSVIREICGMLSQHVVLNRDNKPPLEGCASQSLNQTQNIVGPINDTERAYEI